MIKLLDLQDHILEEVIRYLLSSHVRPLSTLKLSRTCKRLWALSRDPVSVSRFLSSAYDSNGSVLHGLVDDISWALNEDVLDKILLLCQRQPSQATPWAIDHAIHALHRKGCTKGPRQWLWLVALGKALSVLAPLYEKVINGKRFSLPEKRDRGMLVTNVSEARLYGVPIEVFSYPCDLKFLWEVYGRPIDGIAPSKNNVSALICISLDSNKPTEWLPTLAKESLVDQKDQRPFIKNVVAVYDTEPRHRKELERLWPKMRGKFFKCDKLHKASAADHRLFCLSLFARVGLPAFYGESFLARRLTFAIDEGIFDRYLIGKDEEINKLLFVPHQRSLVWKRIAHILNTNDELSPEQKAAMFLYDLSLVSLILGNCSPPKADVLVQILRTIEPAFAEMEKWRGVLRDYIRAYARPYHPPLVIPLEEVQAAVDELVSRYPFFDHIVDSALFMES